MNELSDIIPEDFSGAIMVSRDGEISFAKGFGFADIPNQISKWKLASKIEASQG